jgi:hypothetical protein
MEYAFRLEGSTSLLMHADDVLNSDDLVAWRRDPKNKSVSVPGDDRSPAWTWQSYLYHDGTHIAIPQECLMASLRSAGAKMTLKGQTTFKALSQSALTIGSEYCEFTNAGKQISVADILKLRNRPFAEQVQGAREQGFDLHVKRAAVGTAKHVRVRPKFSSWAVSGTIEVSDPVITESVLSQMFEIAGRKAGLGDWRPSAPKSPGPYGMFSSQVRPLK